MTSAQQGDSADDAGSVEKGRAGVAVEHLEQAMRVGLSREEAQLLHDLDPKEQARIFRKIDFHLVPMLMLLYLIANLDRANIGNAKIEGLEKSLKMTGTDYNVVTMMFFIPYILLEVPSNSILLKFKRPSTYIGLLVTSWGIVMACHGVVSSYATLIVCRILLGALEAGFFPGAVFLLSQWYPPNMTQFRMSLMYVAAAISGAFSGLLAAGIAKMSGTGGYEGWRWIFIIEGIATVAAGVLCFLILPDSPSLSGKWLKAEEIMVVNARDRSTEEAIATNDNAVKTKNVKWTVLFSVLTDWQLYLQALIFMSSAVPNYALKFSMPQIILNMGFTNTQAQLLTAPPYILGAISAVLTSTLADRFTWRLPFIVGPQALVALSYAVLFAKSGSIAREVALCYAFVHVACIGTYPIVPGANTWTINNLAGPAKRAMGIAFMICIGNVGGIIGSFIFRDSEAPTYPTGWGTCLGFVCMGMFAASALEAGYLRINRKRDQLSEEEVRARFTDEQLEKMGDRSPLFRYSL
ncbi:major facilitator superfamily domain-containing protein [Microdochium trichocladiopsis]|uniref:Major facilitator superfamily domain-containing protein n=1 Tax=Microdochium trichocladiopsis TaxID=1682393 RepID=A0A9P8Y3P7_9PEZI|nr:major facilitator superfamily domain-containing protein [Microdochium trichocladiopsis]KAH7030577.1 major facilitator superfamily domain-containing protein [Microdochium trichocladiopsis]